MKEDLVFVEQPKMPVSFINTNKRPSFTNGQLKLLELLTYKLKKGEPVTFQELRRLWLCYVMTERYIEDMARYQPELCTRKAMIENFDREDNYYLSTTVLVWCKANIGALVLKGALVTIPVLEIGEQSLKYLDNKH